VEGTGFKGQEPSSLARSTLANFELSQNINDAIEVSGSGIPFQSPEIVELVRNLSIAT